MSPPARAHGGRRTRPHSPAPLRAVPGTSLQREDASRGPFSAATSNGNSACPLVDRRERRKLFFTAQSELKHASQLKRRSVCETFHSHVGALVHFKWGSRRAESAGQIWEPSKQAATRWPKHRQSRVVRGESSRRQRPRRLFEVRTLDLPSRPRCHGTARPQHRSSSRLCARPVSTFSFHPRLEPLLFAGVR